MLLRPNYSSSVGLHSLWAYYFREVLPVLEMFKRPSRWNILFLGALSCGTGLVSCVVNLVFFFILVLFNLFKSMPPLAF